MGKRFHEPCGGMYLQGAARAIAMADIVCMIFAMITNVTGTTNAFTDLRKDMAMNKTGIEERNRIATWLWTLTFIYFIIYATYILLGVMLFIAATKRSLRKCRLYMGACCVLVILAVIFFLIHMAELDADPYVIVMCLCFHAYKAYSLWVIYHFVKEIQSMGDYNDLMRNLTDDEINDFENGNPNSVFVQTNLSKYEKDAYSKPFNKEYEIPWSRIDIDYKTILGTGAFGLVLQGKLTTENGNQVEVAVKTTKSDTDVVHFNSLLMEIKMMAFLGPHVNLVNLLGCITQDIRERCLWIVVELCSNGNLESYMKKNKIRFRNMVLGDRIISLDHVDLANDFPDTVIVNSLEGDGDGQNFKYFSTEDLIFWACEIAKGMEYLQKKKVIHGDLAARNVLLTGENSVKITDFGLSRKLCNYEPYLKRDATPMPWRYMAVESLKCMTFTTKTDVWSYGVTLWELFTLANVPYAGISWSLRFPDDLQKGLRLNKPEYATWQIYRIMQSCWDTDPDGRPRFSDLKDEMMELLVEINPLDYAEREDGRFCFYNG